MKKVESGFTLIELVMVIVILGSLANQAALAGVVGAVGSASEISYAAVVAGNPSAVSTAGASCALIRTGPPGGILGQPLDESRYTVTGTIGTTNGVASACTITQLATNTVTSAQIIAVDVP